MSEFDWLMSDIKLKYYNRTQYKAHSEPWQKTKMDCFV